MNFTDAATVAETRRTADGYLVADARIVRTGVQHYTGAEVGKPELAIVRVYRPEVEVFHHDSLASFSHVPVTNNHPSVAVTAENWKDLAVGETSGEVLRDGHRLRIPLIVKDAAAIREIEGGKRELSAGYTCDLNFESGTTADGEAYDAIQRTIRANHVAIVARGRAGSECRIGDNAGGSWGASPVHDATAKQEQGMTLQKVTVDGITVEMSDTAAQVVSKVQKQLSDAQSEVSKLKTDHVAEIAAKDAEIAKKDGDLAKKDAAIDAEKAKVLSDADLDKRVQARADLLSTAKAIAKDVDTTGLADAAIRNAVVVAKLGDAAIKGKSEAYVDARFEILAEDARKNPADPFRDAVRGGIKPTGTVAQDEDTAWKASIDDLNRTKREAA